MTQDGKEKALQRTLVRIVQQTTANAYTLIALDDAQNLDNASWDFISILSKHYRTFCVVAMRPFAPDKPPCKAAKQVGRESLLHAFCAEQKLQ